MSFRDYLEKEAIQIMHHCASIAGANGTTTSDVIDHYLNNYSDTVFCRGHLRRLVFTPITEKTYRYKTEEA